MSNLELLLFVTSHHRAGLVRSVFLGCPTLAFDCRALNSSAIQTKLTGGFKLGDSWADTEILRTRRTEERKGQNKMSKDTEGKSEKIMDMECKALWYPDSKRNTQIDTFRIQVNKDYGLNLGELGGGGGGGARRKTRQSQTETSGILLKVASCAGQLRRMKTYRHSSFFYVLTHV